MSEMIRLRDYQDEALRAVQEAWDSGTQRPAVVLPTGSGKTVIFSHLIEQFFTAWPDRRAVILVHRDELADQAIAKIRRVAPGLSVGKVKAKDNETGAQIMVCSVQTIARDARLGQLLASQAEHGRIGLVIVDECHHAAAASYRKIMESLGCFEPEDGTRTAGFTATLARGDGTGLGSVWQEVVYSRSVPWMISRGHLTDVRGQSVDLDQLDLSAVPRTGGDYRAGALGTAITAASGPQVISRALREYASDRRTMAFLPDVASATAVLQQLRDDGWSADLITGETSREDRRLIFKRTRTGDTRVLVNCMVLTEGTDLPWMDCAMIARPTRSEPLFVQMVGRVLRPWLRDDGTDKPDALVLLLNGAGGAIRTLVDLAPGTVREVRPSETLAEAVVRQAEEDDAVESGFSNLAFALKHRDVELFRASSRQWLRTPGGVMFIPYRRGFVFLWPRPDSDNWDVCGAVPHRPWRKFHHDLPLGTAQAWAETLIEEAGGPGMFGALSLSGSRWRGDRAEIRQISKARALGIKVTGTPSKGWLSDQISIRTAGSMFDSYVNRT